MRPFWKKTKDITPEVKNAPDLGRAMAVQGYAHANWMDATPEALAQEGYVQNAVGYACVNKIASAVASVDIDVARYVGKEKQELENHPLYELIERPNFAQGGAAFFKALVSYKKISGGAYVLKLPKGSTAPVELWLLRPDRVRILHDTKGQISAFEYSTSVGKVTFPVDPITHQSDVLYLKEFHPLDDYYGLSPMRASAKSVDIVNNANAWNMSLLQNGARPCGAFVMKQGENSPGELSDEQYTRLREQLHADTGASAAGKPMILEGGLDWKEMSLSPKDMDFKDNMWAAARMIATAFGVPPQLVNIPGESTYNNLSEAKLSFWQETVLPELDYILDELNNWLTPIYGDDIFLAYNESSIPALEPRMFSKYERLEKVSFMTMNEKRRAIGLPDVDGGDVLLADSGKVPLEILSDAPAAE